MTSPPGAPGRPSPRRIHPAWTVAAVTLGALVAASAFRSSTGVLIEPIEAEFGWSRATTSGAVSLNLILYGLTAPFAAALMERWGIRRTVTIALLMVGLGSALTTVMTAPWQLWLLWGVLVGVGTGSMALVFGAIVANRWFHTHRGLITGVFSAASATGQLLFLPTIAAVATHAGWRWAAGIVAGLAVLCAALVATFLHDRPADRGFLPYGVAEGYAVEAPPASPAASASAAASSSPAASASPAAAASVPVSLSPVRKALDVLRMASRRWAFWGLVLTFWVCGWSTNGLIQTHFIPAAHDHGMPATTAAGLLAVVGVFDVVGTIGSGWLTDRFDSRILLAVYYGGRGLSLLVVGQVLAASVEPGMWAFIVFYGLDWVATVPPTVQLCREHFGLEDSGIVFGWVFASHMVGAGAGASLAGWIRASTGTYAQAWVIAAVLCFASVAVALSIPKRPASAATPDRQPTPVGS